MKFIEKLQNKFYIYIFKELAYILFLALGILTFILIMSKMGRIADLVINKGVDLKDIILLIIYSSPPFLTFTLPMAFLLSTIVVLGRLSAENEILILKTSGIDLKYLFYPIAAVGIIITIVGFINTNLLLPKSGELFRDTLINVVKKGVSVDDKEGVFNDSISGVVIYIDKVDTKNKSLLGILVSDDRDKDVKQMISADKGYVNYDPASLDLYFVLEKGSLHRWEKINDVYRNLSFKNYSFSINLTNMLPGNVSLRKRPYEMDIKELRQSLASASASDRYDLLLEIYKKFSIPFSSLAFIFLTIPLGVRRRIEGKVSGIIYSLALFIFYYILMAFTENVGKSIHLPALLTSFIPNILIIFIGLNLLKHLNSEENAGISEKLKYLWGHYLEKVK
ncbi:MAG: LptF/LptG family permease [Proteobacteria bacterium]|nr:LptF/LptG family permease [Pseudomonadota bacterium]